MECGDREGAQRARLETAWSDAGPIPGDPGWAGGTRLRRSTRSCVVTRGFDGLVLAADLRIGGEPRLLRGPTWLWRAARASSIDSSAGQGSDAATQEFRRELRLGEALDFWRVTAIEPREAGSSSPRRCELPGIATLALRARAGRPRRSDGRRGHAVGADGALPSRRGLAGLAYWYAVYAAARDRLRRRCSAGWRATRWTSASLRRGRGTGDRPSSSRTV
jgi:hypothetical protein